jgi:chloramphenicol 3-O phosphotransferase
MSAAGKVILLHGASSSGKSSIARELQARIDEPFWHVSIDHLRDAGVLPLQRIRSGEFDWKGMREAFFAGFHSSLPAYAEAGNNLIVEHIVETERWLRRLVELLAGVDVYLVGVHCPLDELERREQARGDRPPGDARRDFETIHAFTTYDLELDALERPITNADRVIAAWKARRRPCVFDRLRG